MDPAQAPIPRKLRFAQGAWTLELEQLIPIDTHVLRPSTYEVRGADAILGWLRASGEHRGLLSPTRELLERTPADQDADAAFEMRAERWVQVSRVRAVATSSRELQRDREEMLERIAHLEAEVAFLSDRLSAALSKLDSLATTVRDLGDGIPVRNVLLSSSAPVVQPPIIKSEPAPAAAQAAQPAHPASLRAQAPEHQRLILPPVRNIDQALKLLVGEKTALTDTPAKKHAQIMPTASWWAMSLLQDDSGETVGCVAADLEGTIRLGGGMMMLPPAYIAEQIRTRSPSEEVHEAISEVFNNICALLNGIKSNPHVRSTPAQLLSAGESLPDWASTTNTRLLLDVSEGGWLVVTGR